MIAATVPPWIGNNQQSKSGLTLSDDRRERAERELFALLAASPPPAEIGQFLYRLGDILKLSGAPRGVDNLPGSKTPGAPILHLVARNFLGSPLAGEVARLLLDAGAAIEAVDGLGETALHVAIRLGNLEVVDRLLANRADPNRENPAFSANAIDLVAEVLRYPDCEVSVEVGLIMLRQLVQHGARVVEPANGRPDALLLLAGGNDHGRKIDLPEAIVLLLQAGADVHRREIRTGRSAIHYAFLRGYWRTADVLFRAGASPYAKDNGSLIPADYAENGLDAQHELRAIMRAAEMRLLNRVPATATHNNS